MSGGRGLLVVGCLALFVGCASAPRSASPPPAWSAGVQEPEWWNTGVFYEIFVRSFLDTDGNGIGDLSGVARRLDYLHGLGVTDLWLMPINPSPSYHGYDITDYDAVNPAYGTLQDFQALVDAVHAHGMHLIMDLVLNHTSARHPWFLASRDPASPYRDWYRWSDTAQGPGWHDDGGGSWYYGHFGPDLPDLNLANPDVVAELQRIAREWLVDRNVDGFRLDAVRYFIEEDGKTEDTAGTLAFLKGFVAYCRSIKPDAFLVGEAWESSVAAARYTSVGGLDQVFSFDLATGIITALKGGSANQFTYAQKRDLEVFKPGRNAPFLSNHDQERIASQVGGSIASEKLAAALLLTAPGTPFLYYGEEIGMTGRKPDEGIRTPMQWSSETNVGFSTGTPWEPPNGDAARVNVAAELADSDSLLAAYSAIVALRLRHPALQGGQTAVLSTGNESLVAVVRRSASDIVLTLANVGDAAESLSVILLPADLSHGTAMRIEPLWGGGAPGRIGMDGDAARFSPGITVPPKTALIFSVVP